MPSSAVNGLGEPRWLRVTLVAAAFAVVAIILVLPLLVVVTEATRAGMRVFIDSVRSPDAVSAIRLTLLVAAIAVPLNTVFGLAAAWCITRYRFMGRGLLLSLIALPFSISPVISGLVWVLLFGLHGWFGPWLHAHNVQIIFALPGIVLATVFVTVPFVARQVIPIMQARGQEEETAALTLGASGWQIFLRITLPRIRWGVMNGVLLCNARAMGEFGAVSVVSGHISGLTNTMPLQIEILYNDYNLPAAFAVASLLAGLAILTLAAKAVLETRQAAIA